MQKIQNNCPSQVQLRSGSEIFRLQLSEPGIRLMIPGFVFCLVGEMIDPGPISGGIVTRDLIANNVFF